MAVRNLIVDKLRRFVLTAVEAVSAAWVRGRLRALRETRQCETKPQPKATPKAPSFADHVQLIASSKAENDARQREWQRNEEHVAVCIGMGCFDCNKWHTERTKRVRKLEIIARRDAQHQIGIDRSQIAAHVGIPESDVTALLESWGL